MSARYFRIADAFDVVVRGVTDSQWDTPTPCEGWQARHIIEHLVEWVPGFLTRFCDIDIQITGVGPAQQWMDLDEALRRAITDENLASRHVAGPMGESSIETLIDRFITEDLLVHGWDLAVSTSQEWTFLAEDVEGKAQAMEPMDAVLRESGHYGPRVPVPPGASAAEQFLGFIGRDPAWAQKS